MSSTVTVTNQTGTLKKIATHHLKVRDSFNLVWTNTNAVDVTRIMNNDINIQNRESLLIQAGESVTLEFKPNLTGSDGQGMIKIPFMPLYTMRVTAVTTDDVFIINAGVIKVTDNLAAIWGNPAKITVNGGESLETGDYILCKTSGRFSVEITMPFTASGILPPVFTIEMPGIEEGLNEISLFCNPLP